MKDNKSSSQSLLCFQKHDMVRESKQGDSYRNTKTNPSDSTSPGITCFKWHRLHPSLYRGLSAKTMSLIPSVSNLLISLLMLNSSGPTPIRGFKTLPKYVPLSVVPSQSPNNHSRTQQHKSFSYHFVMDLIYSIISIRKIPNVGPSLIL